MPRRDLRAGSSRREKRRKSLVRCARAKARALVPHRDLELGLAVAAGAVQLCREADLAALVAVLDGVVEQVRRARCAAAWGRSRRAAPDGGRSVVSRTLCASICVRMMSIATSMTSSFTFTRERGSTAISPSSTRARSRYSRTRSSRYWPLRAIPSILPGLLWRELAEVALREQLGVGDHGCDRALELVAHEAQHLGVGVVGGLELLDAPGLLDRLAEALGDRHLQLDVARVVGAGLRASCER